MSKEISTNLVIIGGGAAGMMAAVCAYELGERDIIILEKTKIIGGGGRCALGPGGIGSPAQERLGIKYNMDEEFLKYMNWCHWKSDAKLVRAYLEHSGDFFRWGEAHGLVYQTVLPSRPDDCGESRVVHIRANTGGIAGGVAAVNKIVEVIKEYGITCYTKAVTQKILMKSGHVAGVEAEIDGEHTVIHAKCVMVATGNFGANKELVNKNWPNYRGEDIDFFLLHSEELQGQFPSQSSKSQPEHFWSSPLPWHVWNRTWMSQRFHRHQPAPTYFPYPENPCLFRYSLLYSRPFGM